MPGFALCDVCEERAWEHLHYIARHWDDLGKMLTHPESSAYDGMPKAPDSEETGIELNEKVLETRTRIVHWLHYWVRVVLDDNPGFVGPADEPRAQAKWLAMQCARITRGWDKPQAASFATEARDVMRELRSRAFPSGARLFVPEPLIACAEHTVDAEGARVPCPGHYRAWITERTDGLPDLVCSEDREHLLTPAGFKRAGRVTMRQDAAEALRAKIVGG